MKAVCHDHFQRVKYTLLLQSAFLVRTNSTEINNDKLIIEEGHQGWWHSGISSKYRFLFNLSTKNNIPTQDSPKIFRDKHVLTWLILSFLPKRLIFWATVFFTAASTSSTTAAAAGFRFWLRFRLRLWWGVLRWGWRTGRCVLRRGGWTGAILTVWRRIVIRAVAAWAGATRAGDTFRSLLPHLCFWHIVATTLS